MNQTSFSKLILIVTVIAFSSLSWSVEDRNTPSAVKIRYTDGYACTEGPGDWFEVKATITASDLPEGLDIDDFIFKKIVRSTALNKEDHIYELRNAIDAVNPLYLIIPNSDVDSLPQKSICRLESAKLGLVDLISKNMLTKSGYCATHKMALSHEGVSLFYNRLTSKPDGTGPLIWSEHRDSPPLIVITGDHVMIDGMSKSQLEGRWRRIYNKVNEDSMYRPDNIEIPKPIEVVWKVLHPQDKKNHSIYEFKITVSYSLNEKYDKTKPLMNCQ